jgi:2-methylaconitate cis-trans-isomerase PrpF
MGEKAKSERIVIEHPSGRIELGLSVDATTGLPVATLLRTVRKIFEGNIYARVSMP